MLRGLEKINDFTDHDACTVKRGEPSNACAQGGKTDRKDFFSVCEAEGVVCSVFDLLRIGAQVLPHCSSVNDVPGLELPSRCYDCLSNVHGALDNRFPFYCFAPLS